jgi:hypothetical protein
LTQNHGFWTGISGNVGLVTRTGNQAPGAAAGVIFEGFSFDVAVNAAGRIVFTGYLTQQSPSDDMTIGIWSGVPGDVTLVARKGNPAPGMPAGVNFRSFDSPPTINSSGAVAFRATTTATTTTLSDGVWRGASVAWTWS